MTRTIPNVPRELLAELQEHIHCHHDAVLWGKVCDLLSATSPANHVEDVRAMVAAPSPAGVDGLEVVGWYRMDDRKAITPYPSVCATWHKMGVKVGAAYSDSAHAIIDGLRGEVAALRKAPCECGAPVGYVSGDKYHAEHERLRECRAERDQQAQRIGELEADRDSHQRCAIQAMAELAALKAQEPVANSESGLEAWAAGKFGFGGVFRGELCGNTDWALARLVWSAALAYAALSDGKDSAS